MIRGGIESQRAASTCKKPRSESRLFDKYDYLPTPDSQGEPTHCEFFMNDSVIAFVNWFEICCEIIASNYPKGAKVPDREM